MVSALSNVNWFVMHAAFLLASVKLMYLATATVANIPIITIVSTNSIREKPRWSLIRNSLNLFDISVFQFLMIEKEKIQT
jgi:hypothetical protein